MRFPLIARALFVTAALPLPAAAQQTAPAPVVEKPAALTADGVPAIPQALADATRPYMEYRTATLQGWNPKDGSMLITTRFGATSQVHRVAAPGADRTQLTFFDEPIGDAETIPGTNRFLIERDTGGDEWFQIYAMGLTGNAVQLTEPGTRNESLTFSKDGRLAAWSRAVKGSSDRAIITIDPSNPASRRVAFEGKGAIAHDHDWEI